LPTRIWKALTCGWRASMQRATSWRYGSVARLADVQWNGANLSGISWASVRTIGDEHVGCGERILEHEAPVRAYRQISAAVAAQGLDEVAARFAYRSQVLQRRVLLRQLGLAPDLAHWHSIWCQDMSTDHYDFLLSTYSSFKPTQPPISTLRRRELLGHYALVPMRPRS